MATATATKLAFFFLIFLVASSSMPVQDMVGICGLGGRAGAGAASSILMEGCAGLPCSTHDYCQSVGCPSCGSGLCHQATAPK